MKQGRSSEGRGVVPSRVGREKQRYLDGKRLVVGTVAFEVRNQNELYVLLVNSVKYAQEWTIPKGGWEIDESAPQGAMRETLEEAVCLMYKSQDHLGSRSRPNGARSMEN